MSITMKCRQITTFAANGIGYPVEKDLPVTLEADEPRHLESGVINLYPEITYQTITGFGGAMTDTSAYLLSTLTPENHKKAMELLFTEKGNNLALIRVPLDSCDYSLEEYQAVADPIADPEFKTFDMTRNFKYILPALKEALTLCKRPVSVLLSPWSPPWQWKTPPAPPKNEKKVYGALPGMPDKVDYTKPQRCNGGSLKPEHYSDWARYLVKLAEAYLNEGVPVTMMTLQNESIAATNWDSCVWTAQDQKIFLRDHLYPAMKAAGLIGKIGLYIWDHNKERVFEWTRDMLDDTTREMIEGVAFHWYSGDHFEAVKMTAEQYPGLKMMFSECCPLHQPGRVGFAGFGTDKTPETVEQDDAVNYAHDIIGNLNAGMETWFDWNFCVDKDGGPRHVDFGFAAGMIVNDDGTFRTDLIFDYVGHFSRYIQPGAKRAGFSRCDDHAEITAAVNPDGSLAVVALNKENEDRAYALRIRGKVIRVSFPARTLSTLVIDEI